MNLINPLNTYDGFSFGKIKKGPSSKQEQARVAAVSPLGENTRS